MLPGETGLFFFFFFFFFYRCLLVIFALKSSMPGGLQLQLNVFYDVANRLDSLVNHEKTKWLSLGKEGVVSSRHRELVLCK